MDTQPQKNRNVSTAIAVAIVVILVILAFTFGLFDGDRTEIDTNLRGDTDTQQQELPEGLDVEIIEQGEGAAAQNGDLVTVHYIGRLPDGSVFADSYEQGEPLTFLLGSGQVMAGWDAGIRGMRVGEVRELTISPRLLSENTQFQNLPEGTSVIFEIELVEISEPNGGKG